MVERDLTIRVGLQGQAETQAGLKAEADAMGELQLAANEAAAKMQALGEATVAGGAPMKAALLEARDAVAQLEIAMDRARAAGGPISPQITAALTLFDGQIQALTLSLQKGAAATATAASSTKLFSVEAAFARDNVGGFARGLATMGGAAAGVALPLLLIPAALDLLKRGMEAVGISADDVTVALGGVSKAATEGVKGIEAFQVKLDNLAVAQRAFKTGADLVTAAGLDVKAAFEAMGTATSTADVAGQEFQATIAKEASTIEGGKAALDRFVLGLDAIRVMSDSAATDLQNRFVRALGDIQDGVPGAVEALDKVLAEEKALEKSASDFSAQLKKTYGDDAPAAFAKFVQTINQATTEVEKMKNASLDQDEIFAAEKAHLETLVEGMNRFGRELASSNPALAAQVLALLKYREGHDLATTAIDKHNKAIEAEDLAMAASAQKLKELQLALAEATLQYQRHALAVAQSADKSIEKIRDEAKATQAALLVEIAAVKLRYEQGLIDATTYYTALNTLAAAQNKAASDAAAQEKAVRDKAVQELQILADTHEKVAEKVVAAQAKQATAATTTATAVKESVASQKGDLDSLEQSWIASAEGAARLGQTVQSNLPNAKTLLADLEAEANSLSGALDGVASSAAAAFGGSGGGAGGGF